MPLPRPWGPIMDKRRSRARALAIAILACAGAALLVTILATQRRIVLVRISPAALLYAYTLTLVALQALQPAPRPAAGWVSVALVLSVLGLVIALSGYQGDAQGSLLFLLFLALYYSGPVAAYVLMGIALIRTRRHLRGTKPMVAGPSRKFQTAGPG